jgi:N-methylhydantoinase A/oxoprolinase/acetone carboxylase beta subunit
MLQIIDEAQISHVATAVTAVAAQHVSRNIKPLSVASLLSWSIMTLCGFTLGLPKLDF